MNPNGNGNPEKTRPDSRAVERGLRKAWIETLTRHKRLGNPIVVWQDGKVTWIPAEEIEIPEPIEDAPAA